MKPDFEKWINENIEKCSDTYLAVNEVEAIVINRFAEDYAEKKIQIYKDTIRAYVNCVGHNEGVDFIDDYYFTDEQWEIIKQYKDES